jgi:hypothetical protein
MARLQWCTARRKLPITGKVLRIWRRNTGSGWNLKFKNYIVGKTSYFCYDTGYAIFRNTQAVPGILSETRA